MDKERIKEKCAEIAKALNEGKTPQEIAEIFKPEHVWDDNDDREYVYYMVDFLELGFGINFIRSVNNDRWRWENEDEIYLIDAKDWANWKSL